MRNDTLLKYRSLILILVVFAVGCRAEMVTTPQEEEEEPKQEEMKQEEPKQKEMTEKESISKEIAVPSLSDKLEAQTAKSREKLPENVIEIFAEGIKEVAESGVVEAALKEGDEAIDGQLPDANGNLVKLSDLWAKGPVVAIWYRGGWCPYCNIQLVAMQETLPAIKAAGGTLVAITPETPDNSLTTTEKNKLEFVVLSDAGNQLAHKYGLVFKLPEKVSPLYKQFIDLSKYNGDESDELPLAATYVIDKAGKIRYSFIDANYTTRAEPADIVEALKTLD